MTPGPGRGWAAGLARPHYWPCRHCDMVGDYHLERDAQLRRSETLDRRDEIDRLIVFRDWLRAYEWESNRPDHDDADDTSDAAHGDEDDDWAAAWAPHTPTVPAPRDPVDQARAAVDAVPSVELLDLHEPTPSSRAAIGDELPDDLTRWEIAS